MFGTTFGGWRAVVAAVVVGMAGGGAAVAKTPANTSGELSEARQKQIAAGVLKVLGAAVANDSAKGEPQDLGDVFFQGFARGLRDELIRSAVDDLFPTLDKPARRLSADLTSAALDGRLTDSRLSGAESRRLAAKYIRAKCPEFDAADELAAFVVGVQEGVRGK